MSEPSGTSRQSTQGFVLAVVPASGGSGATTLVAALGHRAARSGRSCVAVDLQPGGPGLDVAYAVEHAPGIRWSALAAVEGAVDAAALIPRLPSWRGVSVLAHSREPEPLPSEAVVAAVVEGLASRVDVLLLDAPRDVAVTVTRHVDAAVLLAGTGVLELAALAATGRRVAGEVDECFVVLRDRRPSVDLGDEVTRALDLPVLGWLRDDPGVSRNLHRGRGPSSSGPVADLARMILGGVFADLGSVAS